MRSCIVATSAWACLVALLLCILSAGTVQAIEEPPEGWTPPDSAQVAASFQLFDLFDPSDVSAAFDNVFRLYVSESVTTAWDSAEVADFILAVMDDDSTNTDDTFPAIWDYFCYSDLDPTYAGVSFHLGGGTATYTDFVIYLYYQPDFTCPPDNPNFCEGWAFAWGRLLFLPMQWRTPQRVADVGFAHEFQHVCYDANDAQWPMLDYTNINETLSTLAEYMRGEWAFPQEINAYDDMPYDSGIYSGEVCDVDAKYNVQETWMGYLYDYTIGSQADPTDDAVYEWIRFEVEGESEVSMNTLAEVLDNSYYDWIPGDDGDARLRNLFQYFTVAKFADHETYAADKRFGYDSDFNPMKHHGFFKDLSATGSGKTAMRPVDCPDVSPDSLAGHGLGWNVRVLPPTYVLDESDENTQQTVADIYEDADGSRDYIDVATYGTDYIIFKADGYFQDGDEHELHFSLRGEEATPPTNNEVKAWVIAYSTTEDTLQFHPEDVVFIEPLPIDPDSTRGTVVIGDFGRSVKSLVVALTLVETTASVYKDSVTAPSNNIEYFVYEYDYGVYTPEAQQTISWSGDVFVMGDYEVPFDATLEVNPGTNVKVWTSDLAETGVDTARVEMRVRGTASIAGTESDPVVFSAFDASGPSAETDAWWDIHVHDTTGAGAEFDHAEVRNAVAGISANTDITIKNSLIEDCDYFGVSVEGADSVYIRNTIIRDIGFAGVDVHDGTSLRLSRCEIENVDFYGVKAYTGAHLYADTTLVGNCDTGIYVHFEDSLYTRADIDTCTLVENDIAVHAASVAYVTVNQDTIGYNGTGIYCVDAANITITDSKIRNNLTAIACDESSDPKIEGNTIKDNYLGVSALNNSEPDLGWGARNSDGGNIIYNSTVQHVVNMSPFVTIVAANNNWKVHPHNPPDCDCQPKSNKLYGDVIVCPAICDGQQVSGRQGEGPSLPDLPKVYDLAQNHPNPFNPTTTIRYQVPPPGGMVTLAIYNVAGQLVRTVVSEVRAPGYYAPVWKGTDNRGTEVSSGIYFVRMKAPGFVKTRKMVLLK